MEINKAILEPLIHLKGYRIIDEDRTSIRFDSWKVSFLFSVDAREKAVLFYIGYKYDDVLFDYIDFNYVTQIIRPLEKTGEPPKSLDPTQWLQFYLDILLANGYILEGDKSFFSRLKEYYETNVQEYNSDLQFRQIMRKADEEWDKKNYNKYVMLIDQIDSNRLSSSDKEKYKYAVNKTKDY